jgi:PAS domain S-box-containing protein
MYNDNYKPELMAGIILDITERKLAEQAQHAAEQALRESDETFRQMAENIHEVFWLTDVSKTQMLYISPAYESIWGRSCETLYADPMQWMEAIHPEDRAEVREALSEQPEGDYDETYRVVTPEGELRWVRDRAFPVEAAEPEARTRIVGIAEDVTREKEYREELEQAVRARTRQLERTQRETLERLAAATEYRDDTTGAHTRRVAVLSERIARQLGREEEWAQALRTAAPLHDVGKVAVPDRVLLKEGALTDEEYETMKRHAEVGADLLSGGASTTIRMAETVARSHHERWDGDGYPRGLAGEAIPLAGRIVALADAVDAITHERPYSDAAPLEEALAEVDAEAGAQFDPEVAAVFLEHGPGMVRDLDG